MSSLFLHKYVTPYKKHVIFYTEILIRKVDFWLSLWSFFMSEKIQKSTFQVKKVDRKFFTDVKVNKRFSSTFSTLCRKICVKKLISVDIFSLMKKEHKMNFSHQNFCVENHHFKIWQLLKIHEHENNFIFLILYQILCICIATALFHFLAQ